MSPDSNALTEVLAQVVDLLDAHGEAHWAEWMRHDHGRVLAGDIGGVEHPFAAHPAIGTALAALVCICAAGGSVTPGMIYRRTLGDGLDEGAWTGFTWT